MRRLTTCSDLIVLCVKSRSTPQEKKEIIGKLVRISSEAGSYRNTADVISSEAFVFLKQNEKVTPKGLLIVHKTNASIGFALYVSVTYAQKRCVKLFISQ